MEAKDLILLMLIPILLVSIVVYTSKNPVVTGVVTAKPEESNVIGVYSIMPSFKAKIDYNLQDEYKNLNTKLRDIIEICKKRQDIEQCIKDYIKDKKDNVDWECPENDEDVLNDFVDKLKDCKNLKEENVVCRFSLDDRNYINKIKNERTFGIILTNLYKQIKVELIEDKNILKTEIIDSASLLYTNFNDKDKEGQTADEIRIIVKYTSGKPEVKGATARHSLESVYINLNSMFLLYKAKDGVKFIDADQDAGFREDTPINKIIDLPKTRGIKFCAKSDKQIYAYDASDSQVNLRNIIYKFAVTFPKPVPKPIENLEVHDALNAEHSAILMWDKSNEIGIKSYSIYYSQKDFIKDKIEDVKKDAQINKISAKTDIFIEIDDIDLSKCSFDPIGKTCKYALYGKALENGKLYYLKPKDKEKGKFIYLINDVEDGTEYNFAVTGVNDDNEELDNDNSIEGNTYILKLNQNYRKFKPIDDLAPNKVENLKQRTEDGKVKLVWDKPLKNLDGSTSFDIKGFNIYYKKPSIEMLSKLDILSPLPNPPAKKAVTAAEAKCESIVAIACEYSMENLALEKDQIYIVAVIAFDENSNEFTNDLEVIPVKAS